MTTITYVHQDGNKEALDVADGLSVMEGAIANGIDGIVAECGGNCMCATCHVYVEPSQLGLLSEISEEEDALLDGRTAILVAHRLDRHQDAAVRRLDMRGERSCAARHG